MQSSMSGTGKAPVKGLKVGDGWLVQIHQLRCFGLASPVERGACNATSGAHLLINDWAECNGDHLVLLRWVLVLAKPQ